MTDMQAETAGWTARGLVATAICALSTLFVFLFLYGDRAAAANAEGIRGFVTTTLLGHALGGFIVGVALSGLFGRRGGVGWLLAVLGGVLATLLSGALGGLINAMPNLLRGGPAVGEFVRIGSATFVTPLAIAAMPALAALWLAVILALHVAVRRLRAA